MERELILPEVLTVERVENHIYFYSEVSSDRCLALMRMVRELDRDLRNEALSRDLPASWPAVPIWLHVHSAGGELLSALGVADQLPRIRTPIYSIIEGYCASAATFIPLSCTRRYITPSAYILIHQLSALALGTYSQIKDEVHLLDMAMERLTAFYASHSKMEREDIREMLRHDSWFDAQECLARGFVDEVLGASEGD